jgi:hypothetical protein
MRKWGMCHNGTWTAGQNTSIFGTTHPRQINNRMVALSRTYSNLLLWTTNCPARSVGVVAAWHVMWRRSWDASLFIPELDLDLDLDLDLLFSATFFKRIVRNPIKEFLRVLFAYSSPVRSQYKAINGWYLRTQRTSLTAVSFDGHAVRQSTRSNKVS